METLASTQGSYYFYKVLFFTCTCGRVMLNAPGSPMAFIGHDGWSGFVGEEAGGFRLLGLQETSRCSNERYYAGGQWGACQEAVC